VVPTPELVPVALVPLAVAGLLGAVRAGGFLDPALRQQPAALPHPVVQVELAEAGDVLGCQEQPETAGVDARR